MTQPSPPPYVPQIRLYQDWLARERGLHFDSYDALWRWSVTELDAFWQSQWDYLGMLSPTPHTAVLARNTMPGAQWFPGARVSYARQALRHVQAAHAAGMPAIIADNERHQRREISWPELQRQSAALALHLRAQGVQRGDRVAAYLPNTPEAMIALLAVASLGAVWSVCAPDMGTPAVLDRLGQITPRVLIGCDGITYGGRDMDRLATLAELRAGLPSVQHVIVKRQLAQASLPEDVADWDAVVARNDAEVAAFEPEWLPFHHPLWIVYSSGTTGLPKPIVHDHGGALLNGQAHKTLQYDVSCSYQPNSWGERFMWYSSTGWVMWNAQLSGLLGGTTCVIYDGHPGGSKEHPDWGVLWRYAARERVSFFGAGAAYFTSVSKSGLDLCSIPGLARIRALGCTGSPLTAEVQQWGSDALQAVYAAAGRPQAPPVWWCNISGGTDAGAFIGAHRELPMVAGEMQCRLLGVSVEAWNEQGRPVIDEVGELVVTQPVPSMPPFFWGDADFQRYRGSYFDMYPPGQGRRAGGGDAGPETGPVWRHGDWLKITPEGRCIIYGRSDATINRHGLRMGTSELYRAVEALPEILDSLVVDLEYLGRESWMPLFVVLREGHTLDAALQRRIQQAIRQALSPRFVPDEIHAVAEVPRTLSGKKQELPIKKLLLGQPLDKVLNKDAMANPHCLDWYVALAAQRRALNGTPDVTDASASTGASPGQRSAP
ncbi:MAG: acetoacetate--CoA ligase [Rubrivivax sp.]|nr:acetoacetate--CoA ligase [Rubrivivax sp.]